MEKQKEKKIPKKKHKRKVSIFTIFLWLFLIATMSTITIGSLTHKNAIEVTDNNWNIDLVMYDRSDGSTDAITEFTWNAVDSSESKQLVMQINYACTTGKEYQPGEIEITIPGISKDNFSEFWRSPGSFYYEDYENETYEKWLENNVVLAADKTTDTEKRYDWSYSYDSVTNTYTFVNNYTVSLNEHFEGSIQITYNLLPRLKEKTDLEFQAKIKENIEADEIIAMESRVCSFHYTSTRKVPTFTFNSSVAPKADFTKITDINVDDYYWVEQYFGTNLPSGGVLYPFGDDTRAIVGIWSDRAGEECIKESFPEGCVVYDEYFRKVEPTEDETTYAYLYGGYYYVSWMTYYHGTYYIGYPKSSYTEGQEITSTAELWARYEDQENMEKISESTKTLTLKEFDFEYTGNLYSINKWGGYSNMNIYVNDIKNGGGETHFRTYFNAMYVDSIMDVEVSDDLLLIQRENGDITKLEDDEYHFIKAGVPQFSEYNKYTASVGDVLSGYTYEVQVRYAGTQDFVTYKTGITGTSSATLPGDTTARYEEVITFDRDDVVAVKVVLKDVDTSVYCKASGFGMGTGALGVNIIVHTDDVASGNIYNFSNLQVYTKDEDGTRTLANVVDEDSYSTVSSKVDIAAYDMATYGTYLQRSYGISPISSGSFSLGNTKSFSNPVNQAANKKYVSDLSLHTDLNITHWNIDSTQDFSIYVYDILPTGMNLESTESEILEATSLKNSSGSTTFDVFKYLTLKDGTTFDSEEQVINYIKDHTTVDIDYDYQGSGRTKISIKYDLNGIDFSYYLTHGGIAYITNTLQVSVSHDSVLEYGTSYDNYIYTMWGNTVFPYASGTKYQDNGVDDALAQDIDQDGNTTEYLERAKANLGITSAVASQQAVIKQVKTDLTQGQYFEGTEAVSAGGKYEYKLRVTTGANKLKNLILYDNIETILDDQGSVTSTGWKGSFLGVDTSYAESKGYAPKIYYSTELNPGKLTEVPDKWTLLEDSVDKSTIKSICIDLRYDADGGEIELPANDVVFVLIKMQAPDDESLMVSANNMFSTNWNAIDPSGIIIDNVEGIYSNQVNVEIDKTSITKNISGTKIWEDDENALGLRPASIVVKLMQDGAEYARQEVTGNDWTYTFENVPVYRNNAGDEFVYTIEEEAVTGYHGDVTGNDITNRVDKTEVEVTKQWVGDEGTTRRPDKVTIQLKKGGVVLEEKEANAANSWKVTFTDLAKYEDNGDEIVYTVDEKEDLAFYTKSIVGYVITNTFTVPDDKIQITGVKAWNDNENEAGKRPDSITLQVKNGDQVVTEQEVSKENDWKYTFELPKYDSLGNEITYTIDEKDTGSKFYVKEKIEGYTVTNKFEVPNETVEVTAEKKWNDNSNEARKRPTSVTLQVKNGEAIVAEQVVTEAEGWKHTFTNLPKYDSLGNEITYSVDEKEDLKFYTKGIVGNVITNTFTVPDEKVSITGVKSWNDNNNAAGKRPASIVLQVKNGTQVVASQTVTEAMNWRYTFEGLTKYDSLGNEIHYTIDEESTNSIFYKKENTSDTVVTNIFEVPNDTVEVQACKAWVDNSNAAGKRPTSIVLQVKDGNKVVAEQEVNNGDNWSYTFTNLPKYDSLGNEILYTVDEKEVPEFYTKTVAGYVVTNTFEVPGETVSITGEKKWNDNNNAAGKRPASVTLQVKNGTEIVATQTVTETNNWKYTFTNLPKYDENADEIHYTIDEESTNSIFYQKENTSDTVVTNTFAVPNDTIELEAKKQWVGDDGANKRPTSIVLQVKNGEAVVAEQEVTEKTNWSHTFTNLPKYDSLGNEILYTVDEKEIPDFYAKTILGNVVTNTFTVPDDKIKIVGQKEWQDNEDEAGKRPESVMLQVKANGAVVTEAEVNENNLWRYEFELPKYDSLGNEITYTIDERELNNQFYQKIGVEENVVINKFVVPDEKVQIKVQKSWDDNENAAGRRPSSILLQVKNGDQVVAEYEVSEADNWEHTFELAKYDSLGNEINYTVDETFESEYYIKNIVGNVITNTFVAPEDIITIVGTKEWNDNDNLAGKRPESVILQIKNGETVVAEQVVNEACNWSYSFDLEKYDELGNEINYTLSERALDSIFYEKEMVDDTDMLNQKVVNKFVVPNEQVLIQAVKKWEDNNDEYGKRPDSVVLQVLVDGEVIAEQEVGEEENWSYEFKLPKYDELGNEIVYTVDEKETDRNYEKHVEGTTVINTSIYEPPVDTSDIPVWVYFVAFLITICGFVLSIRYVRKNNVAQKSRR